MDRHLLVSLLDTIKQPAILMNSDYQVVAANLAYRSRYNYHPGRQAEYCYQVSHGYKRPCDEEGELCPFKAAQASGKPERAMHVHNTPEGKEHIDVHLEPIFAEDGKLQYFLEILHEVNKTSRNHISAETTMKGESRVFNQMLLQLSRAADSNVSVLLLGESGTGKELAARFLHENSPRRHQPFVTVECAGLSDNLFESELFGHVKGAFTGAVSNKQGLVASAQGGTLFLDELGDVPLSQQVKLLRLIETGMYRPVGSVENHHADFRLVCATNRNLTEMVSRGEFRQDLFYRINTFPVFLPPLRERPEDIEQLARAMLQELSGNLLVHFSDAALAFLRSYPFPGNIRELRNMVERGNLLRNGNRVELADIKPVLQAQQAGSGASGGLLDDGGIVPLKALEQTYLQQLQQRFPGSKSELAAALGISERTLYRKLQALQE